MDRGQAWLQAAASHLTPSRPIHVLTNDSVGQVFSPARPSFTPSPRSKPQAVDAWRLRLRSSIEALAEKQAVSLAILRCCSSLRPTLNDILSDGGCSSAGHAIAFSERALDLLGISPSSSAPPRRHPHASASEGSRIFVAEMRNAVESLAPLSRPEALASLDRNLATLRDGMSGDLRRGEEEQIRLCLGEGGALGGEVRRLTKALEDKDRAARSRAGDEEVVRLTMLVQAREERVGVLEREAAQREVGLEAALRDWEARAELLEGRLCERDAELERLTASPWSQARLGELEVALRQGDAEFERLTASSTSEAQELRERLMESLDVEDAAVERCAFLCEELARAHARQTALRGEVDAQSGLLARARADNSALRGEVDAASQEMARVRALSDDLRGQVDAAAAELARARGAGGGVLEVLESQVVSLREEVYARVSDLQDLRGERDALSAGRECILGEMNALVASLGEEKEAMSTLVVSLGEDKEAMGGEAECVRRERDALREELEAMRLTLGEGDALREEVVKLRAQVESVRYEGDAELRRVGVQLGRVEGRLGWAEEEARRGRGELEALRVQLEGAVDGERAAKGESVGLRGALMEERLEAATTKGEAESLKAAVEEGQRLLSETRERAGKLEGLVAKLQAREGEMLAAVEASEEGLAKAKAELGGARERAEMAVMRLEEVRMRVGEGEDEAGRLRVQLARAQEEAVSLREQVVCLEGEVEDARGAIGRANEELDGAVGRCGETEGRLRARKGELEELSGLLAEAEGRWNELLDRIGLKASGKSLRESAASRGRRLEEATEGEAASLQRALGERDAEVAGLVAEKEEALRELRERVDRVRRDAEELVDEVRGRADAEAARLMKRGEERERECVWLGERLGERDGELATLRRGVDDEVRRLSGMLASISGERDALLEGLSALSGLVGGVEESVEGARKRCWLFEEEVTALVEAKALPDENAEPRGRNMTEGEHGNAPIPAPEAGGTPPERRTSKLLPLPKVASFAAGTPMPGGPRSPSMAGSPPQIQGMSPSPGNCGFAGFATPGVRGPAGGTPMAEPGRAGGEEGDASGWVVEVTGRACCDVGGGGQGEDAVGFDVVCRGMDMLMRSLNERGAVGAREEGAYPLEGGLVRSTSAQSKPTSASLGGGIEGGASLRVAKESVACVASRHIGLACDGARGTCDVDGANRLRERMAMLRSNDRDMLVAMGLEL